MWSSQRKQERVLTNQLCLAPEYSTQHMYIMTLFTAYTGMPPLLMPPYHAPPLQYVHVAAPVAWISEIRDKMVRQNTKNMLSLFELKQNSYILRDQFLLNHRKLLPSSLQRKQKNCSLLTKGATSTLHNNSSQTHINDVLTISLSNNNNNRNTITITIEIIVIIIIIIITIIITEQ